jgi:hypothetical protein
MKPTYHVCQRWDQYLDLKLISLVDSCGCHWQVGYDCPECGQVIVDIHDHMKKGRIQCKKKIHLPV